MRKEYRFHVVALLIGFLALWIFQVYVQSEGIIQMPYSDFKKAIREGRVVEVTLTNEIVRGKLRPADAKDASVQQPFVAIRVTDPDVILDLEAKNVKFTGTIQSSWLRGRVVLVDFWTAG